jgi:hypothetical protein
MYRQKTKDNMKDQVSKKTYNIVKEDILPVFTIEGEKRNISIIEYFQNLEKYLTIDLTVERKVAMQMLLFTISNAALIHINRNIRDKKQLWDVDFGQIIVDYLNRSEIYSKFDIFTKDFFYNYDFDKDLGEETVDDLKQANILELFTLFHPIGNNLNIWENGAILNQSIELRVINFITHIYFNVGNKNRLKIKSASDRFKKMGYDALLSNSPLLRGAVFTCFEGRNAKETIWLNLILSEDIIKFGGEIGKPLWEAKPKNNEDFENLKNNQTTFLGMMLPLYQRLSFDKEVFFTKDNSYSVKLGAVRDCFRTKKEDESKRNSLLLRELVPFNTVKVNKQDEVYFYSPLEVSKDIKNLTFPLVKHMPQLLLNDQETFIINHMNKLSNIIKRINKNRDDEVLNNLKISVSALKYSFKAAIVNPISMECREFSFRVLEDNREFSSYSQNLQKLVSVLYRLDNYNLVKESVGMYKRKYFQDHHKDSPKVHIDRVKKFCNEILVTAYRDINYANIDLEEMCPHDRVLDLIGEDKALDKQIKKIVMDAFFTKIEEIFYDKTNKSLILGWIFRESVKKIIYNNKNNKKAKNDN